MITDLQSLSLLGILLGDVLRRLCLEFLNLGIQVSLFGELTLSICCLQHQPECYYNVLMYI